MKLNCHTIGATAPKPRTKNDFFFFHKKAIWISCDVVSCLSSNKVATRKQSHTPKGNCFRAFFGATRQPPFPAGRCFFFLAQDPMEALKRWAKFKRKRYVPLKSWLANRDPYSGLSKALCKWPECHPLYNWTNLFFFPQFLQSKRVDGKLLLIPLK